MATIEQAIAIAAAVHEGQTDKNGAPYILHPLRVMMRMNCESSRIAAILHDAIEDSRDHPPEKRWTLDRLREHGFSEKVIEAVDGVTDRKGQGETYEEFVQRAGANLISRAVKIADLEDNMNLQRLGQTRRKDFDRLEKYHRAWLTLTALNNLSTGEVIR